MHREAGRLAPHQPEVALSLPRGEPPAWLKRQLPSVAHHLGSRLRSGHVCPIELGRHAYGLLHLKHAPVARNLRAGEDAPEVAEHEYLVRIVSVVRTVYRNLKHRSIHQRLSIAGLRLLAHPLTILFLEYQLLPIVCLGFAKGRSRYFKSRIGGLE